MVEEDSGLTGPSPWVCDRLVTHCMHEECEAVFSLLRRKHHCRKCGRVVCDACSKNKVKLKDGALSFPVRVCNRCYKECLAIHSYNSLISDNSNDKNVRHIRMAVLGPTNCGKTSLLSRCLRNQFFENMESTVGAAFAVMKKKWTFFGQTNQYHYEIWDTAGHELYRSLASMYYRSAHVIVVVYDITASSSLHEAQTWLEELKRQIKPDSVSGLSPVLVLMGNKLDVTEARQIKFEQGESLARGFDARFMEVSAKTGENANALFELINLELRCEGKFCVDVSDFIAVVPRCVLLSQSYLATMLPPLLFITCEYLGQMQWSLWSYSARKLLKSR